MSDLVERLRHYYARRELPTWGEIHEAADRIEALEAALRFMLTDPPAALDEPDIDAEIIRHYREVARAALDKDAGKLT